MTLEKQFTLDAAEKPKLTSPVQQRRMKFTSAIDKQLAKLEGRSTSTLTSKAGWVMSHRRQAISFALSPAFTDNRKIVWLRSLFRLLPR